MKKCIGTKLMKRTCTFEPAHEIMVIIAQANSEGSGETAHPTCSPSGLSRMRV